MGGPTPNSGNVSGRGSGGFDLGPFHFDFSLGVDRNVGGGNSQQQQMAQAQAQAPKLGLATLLPLAGLAAMIFLGKK